MFALSIHLIQIFEGCHRTSWLQIFNCDPQILTSVKVYTCTYKGA